MTQRLLPLVLATSLIAPAVRAAEGSTGATKPTAAAPVRSVPDSKAAAPGTVAKIPGAPRAIRDMPGRTIIAQILTLTDEGKKMHVKNLRGEEFDLVVKERTELQFTEPLKVGQTIRTRFDLLEGENVPFFIRVLEPAAAEKAKRSVANPGGSASRKSEGTASPAPSASAAATPQK